MALAQQSQGHRFYFQDLGHLCLDFGAQAAWARGVAVNTYRCNSSLAQQVTVTELDSSHDVQLRIQPPNVNYFKGPLFCIGVRGGQVAAGQQLELQRCSQGSPAQRFALDGDAILMGAQTSGRVTREFAIRPQTNAIRPLRTHGPLTPLIVANREVSDQEYFRYKSVDKSSARPTSGFVLVSSASELKQALTLGWGTVIEIDPSQPIVLNLPCQTTYGPRKLCTGYNIHAGVTLRGYRKYTSPGPIIHACTNGIEDPTNAYGVFAITEDNIRITGLRLHGALNDPLCSQSGSLPEWDAILICGPSLNCATEPHVIVDHSEISNFTHSAVDTFGLIHSQSDYENCPCPAWTSPRDIRVRVIGNSIHDNNGWGSVTSYGAFILNQANVLYGQNGAENFDSDPIGSSGYNAYDNFILSVHSSSAMDMHGSGCPNGHKGDPRCAGSWQGGISGDTYDLGWNTFLPTGRAVVVQRGTPCRFTAVHDNIFVLPNQSDAISSDTIYPIDKLKTTANIYNTKNPMGDLGVGDFDGDGIDDVFVGTGTDWYYSSGGQSEWRFLNRMHEPASALLFGDFDGDGRTDIVALHGTNVDISWGGTSPWETINATSWAISDLAVGDFDGDGLADLFLATGQEWLYAPGGKKWLPLASSSYRTKQLRFGDFTHAGRTQALRVHDGQWLVAGLGVAWKNIGSASASSMDGLVVGDFDGDGLADVARNSSSRWEYSTPAHGGGWKVLRADSAAIASLPIGRFDDNRTSDVLLWNDLRFSYAPSGQNPVKPLSNQDMR